MRRPVVTTLLVAALACSVAACGGDDDRKDVSGPATTTVREETGTSAGATSTSGGARRTTGTTVSPGGTATTTRANAASTTTVSTSPPPTNGSPLSASAVRPAAAGTWAYGQTGSTKLGTCMTYEYPVAPAATLRVDPAHGNRQQAVLSSKDATLTTVLEYRDDGVFLAFLRQEQPTPTGTFVTEFEPVPPVLAVPASPAAGRSWSFTMTSKDGKITTTTRRTVEAVDERVTLGDGTTVTGARIRTDTHATGLSPFGPLDLTGTSETWQSVERRLLLHDVTDTTGKVGACDYHSHVDATLRSTTSS